MRVVSAIGGLVNLPTETMSRSSLKTWNRCGPICSYCGVTVDYETGTVDHIVPKSQGGKRKQSNLVIACIPCNDHKSDKNAEHWTTTSKWLHERQRKVVMGEEVLLPKHGESSKGRRKRPTGVSHGEYL